MYIYYKRRILSQTMKIFEEASGEVTFCRSSVRPPSKF